MHLGNCDRRADDGDPSGLNRLQRKFVNIQKLLFVIVCDNIAASISVFDHLGTNWTELIGMNQIQKMKLSI